MRFIFLGLLIAVSCGKYPKSNGHLGEKRSFSPQAVDSNEMERVTDLCSTLAQKVALLGQGTSETFNFSLATKSCEEEALGAASTVSVNLEISSGSYQFIRTDTGAPFAYPYIETNQSGVMKEICSDLTKLTNPKKLSNGNVLWFTTTQISANDCGPLGGEMCILLETGTPTGENYEITTKDWIKFQMDPAKARPGFFTERKTISRSLCALDKFTQTQVTLK